MDYSPVSSLETTIVIRKEQYITEEFTHTLDGIIDSWDEHTKNDEYYILDSGYLFNENNTASLLINYLFGVNFNDYHFKFNIDNLYNMKQDDLVIEIIPNENSYLKLVGNFLINHGITSDFEIWNDNIIQNDEYLFDDNYIFNDDINGSTLINYLFGVEDGQQIITEDALIELNYGDVFKIDNMLVYINGEDEDVIFNSPLFLFENKINNFELLLDSSSYGSFNLYVTYKKADTAQEKTFYVEGFSVEEVRDQQGIKTNTNPYFSGYSNTEISYNVSIDRLWYDSWFSDIQNNDTFQLIFKTDDNLEDVEQQKYYLSGVSFSNLSKTQDTGIIKEGVTGKACRVFKE